MSSSIILFDLQVGHNLTSFNFLSCILTPKGMLFGMPDAFLRTQAATLGITLPPLNEYAVGNVFFPPENPQVMQDCKMVMERLARQRGLQVLGWRKVPVDNSMLGRDPLDSEPETEQVRLHYDVGMSDRSIILHYLLTLLDHANLSDHYRQHRQEQIISPKL